MNANKEELNKLKVFSVFLSDIIKNKSFDVFTPLEKVNAIAAVLAFTIHRYNLGDIEDDLYALMQKHNLHIDAK